MKQIGIVFIKPHFQRAGKHVNKFLSIMRMGLFVSGTGLHLTQNGIHHMLTEGTERIHGDPRVTIDIQRFSLVLFHKVGLFLCRFKEIQGTLAVEVGEIAHEFQRDISAVFQLAQVGDGDSDLTADFFESITLHFPDFPPFFAEKLPGIVPLPALMDAFLQFTAALPGGSHQHFDGMCAHVFVDGVFADFPKGREILHGENTVVAVRTFGGDEPALFPVSYRTGNHAEHLRNLTDGEGEIVFLIHNSFRILYIIIGNDFKRFGGKSQVFMTKYGDGEPWGNKRSIQTVLET